MSDLEREGPELWQRYRAAALASAGETDPEPDPNLLAAYLEGRLDEAAAEPVEAWLTRDPSRLALIAPPDAGAPVPLAVIRNARALVRPSRSQVWRETAAWMSVAASLVLVGTSGFIAGHQLDDYHESINVALGGDLVYGPGGGDADGAAF